MAHRYDGWYSVEDWEVTYNPHGVETQHEWLRESDDLFTYLTASIRTDR